MTGSLSNPLAWAFVLAALSLLPFLFVMTTSFLKIVVVLSILRNALGIPQVPPNMVVTGLALVLTIYVMAPTGTRMFDEFDKTKGKDVAIESLSLKDALNIVDKTKEPLRTFLVRHSAAVERQMFLKMGQRLAKQDKSQPIVAHEHDFLVILPAFVIGQLAQAFQIGFLLFVPFLVLDLIIANVLLALGMHMLSPTTVSLPFKLLLFVLVDGWRLITEGLVVSYFTG